MSEPEDLRGPILLGALAVLGLDALVWFRPAGGIGQLLRRRRPAASALALAIFAAALVASPRAFAQSSDEQALRSTLETRLAYVIPGDAEVDRISKAGLQGLTLFLAQRTALEAGEPIGLDPARDELAFYPLIYWPIVPSAPKPSREALEHIDAYMKQGGTGLFATRDALAAPPCPRGAAHADMRVAARRQHRDVHAPRQLQGRPGPRSGPAGAAGTMISSPRKRGPMPTASGIRVPACAGTTEKGS